MGRNCFRYQCPIPKDLSKYIVFSKSHFSWFSSYETSSQLPDPNHPATLSPTLHIDKTRPPANLTTLDYGEWSVPGGRRGFQNRCLAVMVKGWFDSFPLRHFTSFGQGNFKLIQRNPPIHHEGRMRTTPQRTQWARTWFERTAAVHHGKS